MKKARSKARAATAKVTKKGTYQYTSGIGQHWTLNNDGPGYSLTGDGMGAGQKKKKPREEAITPDDHVGDVDSSNNPYDSVAYGDGISHGTAETDSFVKQQIQKVTIPKV